MEYVEQIQPKKIIADINSNVTYTVRVDNTSMANITYVGLAIPGTTGSTAAWQIQRVDETTGTIVLFANGNSNFNNIWDNRLSLSYS